ncbi:type VII secretion protein EccE [Dactylosporangium sp. NPDC005572]|uniref:type VII secretion protein EccE n=1 Tax=Dactylosporangium sp. NPDC005572 TaxID=3156889 RepID=UPI00339EB6E4
MASATTRGRVPVTAGRPPAPAPARNRAAVSRRLRLAAGGPGEFGTAQLVAIEIALVAGGAAAFAGTPVAIGAGAVVAAGSLAAGLSRSSGRWAYQSLGLRSAMGRRRRAGAGGLLAAGFQVYGHDDRGSQIGIGQDHAGWFIAVAIGGAGDAIGHQRHSLRLDRLLRLLDEGTARPSAVQLVSFRTLAPAGGPLPNSPAAHSYRELLGLVTGRQTGPATLQTWVALRLTASDALEAAADRGGGMDGVNRTLAAMAGRLGKALNTAGVPYEVLDAHALNQAVHAACGLDGARPGTAVTARERWRGWVAAGRQHVAYEVEHWPDNFDPAAFQALAGMPAEQLVVSVVAARQGADLRLRTIVRVMAAPDRLAAAVQTVRESTRTLGVRLRPLHGQHQPGVYGSAPTGGGTL